MILKLAYHNIFRNKRRAISTGLAICIGFVGLNLLGAYILRTKKALDVSSIYTSLNGHVKIFKKNSLIYFSLQPRKYMFSKIELETMNQMLKQLGHDIEYIGQNINGSGLLSNGKISHPILFSSIEPDVYAKSITQQDVIRWGKEWILPSQLANVEVFRNNNEVMSVTPKIADIMSLSYPLNLNESLQLVGRSLDGDLNAINLDLGAEHTSGLPFLEGTLVLVPLKKIQELLGTEGAESISIYLKPDSKLFDFKDRLDEKLKQLSFEVDSYLYYDPEINFIYMGVIGFLTVMGGFFFFLIGTAVSLSIVNSLTMGIIERTREIGTLYAIGFKKKDISKLFILENLILCLYAILIGVLFSFIISTVVNSLNIRFTIPNINGDIQFLLIWNFMIAFLVSVFVLLLTLISSYLVIKNKTKIKLIDLLNDSGV